jgi:predicted nucleotidyltransferase
MDVFSIQFTKIELKIVKFLFRHYKDRFNSRQLAKLLKINHAHANKLCNSLAEKLLLKKEEIGNSVFFSFDYSRKIALNFMSYLFVLEEKEFPDWLSVVLHSLKKFNEYISTGLVFGSSVKKRDFNDVDVLLVCDKSKNNQIKKIKDEIRNSRLVEKPIRYVDISEKDILLNKDDKIFYNILSESIVFCNPEKYVEVIKKDHKSYC